MSNLLLRGDYNNKATFRLPTSAASKASYPIVGFPLPTVTLKSAQQPAGMGRIGCPGMGGALVATDWHTPRHMMYGLRGTYDANPNVTSSFSPPPAPAPAPAPSGNMITEHPVLIAGALAAGLWLYSQRKKRAA